MKESAAKVNMSGITIFSVDNPAAVHLCPIKKNKKRVRFGLVTNAFI
jgi:hypothetical protein